MLQETKLGQEELDKFSKILGAHNMDGEPTKGASGGLGVVWNLGIVSYDKLRRIFFWMCTRIKSTRCNLNFLLINIYGPNSIQDKRKVWIEISSLMDDFKNQNIIIGGDFNAVLRVNEKWGGITIESQTTKELQELMNKNKLMEIKSETRNYTQNNRCAGFIRITEMLDRFFLQRELD